MKRPMLHELPNVASIHQLDENVISRKKKRRTKNNVGRKLCKIYVTSVPAKF